MHAQSCLTLCNPMDCSQSGSFVCGIFQAKILDGISFFLMSSYFICYIRMSDRIDTFLGRIIFGFGLLHEIWRCSMAAYKKSTMVHGHCSSLSLRDWLPEVVLLLKENWSDLLMSSDAQHRALCTLWCPVLESRSRSMLSSGSPDVWVC